MLESEAVSRSGRYCLGLIAPQIAAGLTPDRVVDYLNTLDWHLYGGSYFGRKGRSTGEVDVSV